MNSSHFNHRTGVLIGKNGSDKFLRLAHNSYKNNKYSLTADNCRIAALIAVREKDLQKASIAYELWIESLFKENKYADIKKVCREARSKFGNRLDLLYYEFKVALAVKDYRIAIKLANEFVGLHKNIEKKSSSFFIKTVDKLEEVTNTLKEIQNIQSNKQNKIKLE